MKRVSSLYPKTVGCAVAAGAILVYSGPAFANGRFPQSNQIVFSPSTPDLVVLRTTYGILPSRDHGATWQFLCEDALGVTPSTLADPSIGLTNDNSLLAGVALGLDVSADTGCNWKCMGGPLANQSIVDLAVRPDTPNSAVAITGTYVASDSGQLTSNSQIFETDDNGVTWTALGRPIDPFAIVETVDVAKTDPNRLYVSGVVGFGNARLAYLFMSKDKGQNWTSSLLPSDLFDPTVEDSIFIGAVDPTNADRVYLRSSAQATGGVSRLTVVTFKADGTWTFASPRTFDAGMAFLGSTGEILGLTVSDDGSTIYIGSVEDGLWRANTSDFTFEKVNSIAVQCLAARGNELWACSDAVSGFVAGVSTDRGKTFTAKLPLIGTLTGPIACAANPAGAACGQQANASQCTSAIDAFCSLYACQLSGGHPTDAGNDLDASRAQDASDADASSHGGSKSSSSSCSLSVPGRGGAAGIGIGLALVAFAAQRRRKR